MHTFTESSKIFFKYLLFSQILMLYTCWKYIFAAIIFFASQYFLQLHWHLSLLHLLFELHVALSNFHFQLHGICLFFYSEAIFVNSCQQHYNFCLLIKNGKWLGLIGFESIRLGIVKHGSLFDNMHLVAKNLQELNNAISICLLFLLL